MDKSKARNVAYIKIIKLRPPLTKRVFLTDMKD